MALCSSPVSHILRSFDENDDLARANYTNWSVCMKSYLLSQDLWDIIEASSEPKPEDSEADFKTWRKKNAAALLAIQNSCEPDILSQIGKITLAKVAWDTLAKIYEPAINPTDRDEVQNLQSPTGSHADSFVSLSNSGYPSLPGIQNINYSQFKPLHRAINKSDWGLIRNILVENPDAINAKITSGGETALHIATIARHLKIVENLLEEMSKEGSEIQDKDGCTALAVAAMNGEKKIAECIIRKNGNLVTIEEANGCIPLRLACIHGHKDLTRYLYSVTPLDFLLSGNGNHGSLALVNFIREKMFDLALDLLSRYPHLTTSTNDMGSTPLYTLSLTPTAFLSGCRFLPWQQWIYSCINIQLPTVVSSEIRVNIPEETQNDRGNIIVQVLSQFRKMVSNLLEIFGIKQIYDIKLMHIQALQVLRYMSETISSLEIKSALEIGVLDALHNAAKRGIVEFTIAMIKADSNLMSMVDTKGRNVFAYAIEYRQEKIFSLLYGFGVRHTRVLSSVDHLKNNMLHLAGTIAPSSQLNWSTASQMQRELQWYKEVESIINPSFIENVNMDNETPRQVFTRNHKDLVKAGEQWIKGAATSCTVVGSLIITMMFAAAFTVPGGNDQTSGFPIFLHKKLFMVFIISDGISLFASITSVLMFIGILTSRYSEDDFLESLPTKLLINLSTLFFSVGAMMVAFSAALLIMLKGQLQIAVPIILLATVPVNLFVTLQFPLIVEVYMSTFGPSIFDRKMKPWL